MVVYVAAMAAVCCLVVLCCLCKSFIEFTVSFLNLNLKKMKKLSRFEVAQIKRTAQNVKMMRSKSKRLTEKRDALNTELDMLNQSIEAFETPIRIITGGLSSEEYLNGETVEEPLPTTVEEPLPTPEEFKAEEDVLQSESQKSEPQELL